MSSTSESSEHQKIHGAKELLHRDARSEFNGGLQTTTWRVSNLIGASGDRNNVIDTTGLLTRILGNKLQRAERRKVREMAGVSDISKIKNHKKREATQIRESIKDKQRRENESPKRENPLSNNDQLEAILMMEM